MTDDTDHSENVSQWLSAISDPAVMRDIFAVHAMIGKAVEEHAPACQQSGRCCRFVEFDHRLYTTGLEAALTISQLHTLDAQPGFTLEASRRATDAGVCPFQIGAVCSVHAIRPAGCRVFFCDPSWSGVMGETAERAAAQIRLIHSEYNIPYRYDQWGALLEMIAIVTGPIRAAGANSDGTTPLTIDTHDGRPSH